MLNQTYSIYYDSICPCVHRNIIGNSVEILSTTLSVICVILIDWKCSMQHDRTPGSSESMSHETTYFVRLQFSTKASVLGHSLWRSLIWIFVINS